MKEFSKCGLLYGFRVCLSMFSLFFFFLAFGPWSVLLWTSFRLYAQGHSWQDVRSIMWFWGLNLNKCSTVMLWPLSL